MNNGGGGEQLSEYMRAWTMFAFAALVAGVGAGMRILTDGIRRTPLQTLVRIVATAWWGGIAAWLISYAGIDRPEIVGGLSGVLGWLGYEGTAALVFKILGKKLGVQIIERRRNPRD